VAPEQLKHRRLKNRDTGQRRRSNDKLADSDEDQ
jgi:hypothetical protein